VIVGAPSVEQLEDNLGAGALDLTTTEIERIDAVAPAPRGRPAWHVECENERRG
jgi:aryl-alcohol dehydrogenase-like predicted oxidoreductase